MKIYKIMATRIVTYRIEIWIPMQKDIIRIQADEKRFYGKLKVWPRLDSDTERRDKGRSEYLKYRGENKRIQKKMDEGADEMEESRQPKKKMMTRQEEEEMSEDCKGWSSSKVKRNRYFAYAVT